MKHRLKTLLVALTLPVVVIAVANANAVSGAPAREFTGRLGGYQEVPAVSSTAAGKIHIRVLSGGDLSYRLEYSDLQGAVQQAHIHFGQPGVNGGISVFLCTNLGNGPAGTQPCPAPPATVTGTIVAADVVGSAAAQGIGAGELDELVRAMRKRVTYANVHSTLFPSGEIRSLLRPVK